MVEDEPLALSKGTGIGQQGGLAVGQQVDIGLDQLAGRLAEAQDPQWHPRVVGRDGEVDRGPIAERLPASRGRIGVEGRRHEDRAAVGIEIEYLGRIGR